MNGACFAYFSLLYCQTDLLKEWMLGKLLPGKMRFLRFWHGPKYPKSGKQYNQSLRASRFVKDLTDKCTRSLLIEQKVRVSYLIFQRVRVHSSTISLSLPFRKKRPLSPSFLSSFLRRGHSVHPPENHIKRHSFFLKRKDIYISFKAPTCPR